ncbi:iron chelate uptake ABC transporter family permease subunit [Staphylococcus delphini]|uniref:iron chelate uptake ABC transporter family permease subunit n=1 Tax=Staphylococcus delphini TaxID=53344 RepID=UPI000BBCC31F|nr:iron chelate uptake ABC transporter family permease subunit [Staphylococcus delphini]MDE9752052.1 iron chelate uptake ABC transporter family permease subunit [Staphylococcus delphini]MDE9790116.1 iron chelate uptake ABC transporter family permease subunit [Staphylococcus delphini]MDE9792342.1 iron chelate uptake ABC transporter family permease subunit [Staphylococcus delphini]MDE9794917.1 iron chelate uptake ABC transporter family permease subunit [Staphylococcus delphini]MDE9797141.1 iron 
MLNHLTPKYKLALLSFLTLLIIALYLFYNVNPNILAYQLTGRMRKAIAMLLVGASIAVSTVIFQTITHNRILTPAIIGLNAVYMFIKTALIFFFGATSMVVLNYQLNFVITLVGMILFSLFLFQILFRTKDQNVFFILLLGIVFGTFFSSLSGFIEMMIDPEAFLSIQSAMFASFNAINESILTLSGIALFIIIVIAFKMQHYLDVLALGRDQAINLGIHYTKMTRALMVMVALLVTISTALVGPITFLGLIVVNLAHEYMKIFEHQYILVTSILISWVSLFLGQWVVEHVFEGNTEISIMINFIGGIYFIFLILKEHRLT